MPRAKRVKKQAEEMEPPANVADVYRHVVEDVMQSVQDDFRMEGVDDIVLLNLRQLWELNLMKCGVVVGAGNQGCGPASKEAGNSSEQLPDLNTTYVTVAEYPNFTSTQEPIMFQYNPPGANDPTNGAAECVEPDIQRGKLPPYVLQPTLAMTKNQWAVDVLSVVEEDFQEKDEAELRQASVGKHFSTVVKEEKE